jgi:hypothetical protein
MKMNVVAPPENDRPTGFQAAVETGEHYNGYTLLVDAYAALWLILIAWLVLVWRKQVQLGARVAGLEDALARASKRTTTAEAEKRR